MAKRTEQAYVGWIRRFILFLGKRHPSELGKRDVEAFLSSLAVRERVASSTQNQALSAILFLYKEILGVELPWMATIAHAKRKEYIPVVLTRDEVLRLLCEISGVSWLAASLLYGSGMRLLECLRLRVKDLDFARTEVTVRRGKGGRGRRTLFPASLHAPM